MHRRGDRGLCRFPVPCWVRNWLRTIGSKATSVKAPQQFASCPRRTDVHSWSSLGGADQTVALIQRRSPCGNGLELGTTSASQTIEFNGAQKRWGVPSSYGVSNSYRTLPLGVRDTPSSQSDNRLVCRQSHFGSWRSSVQVPTPQG